MSSMIPSDGYALIAFRALSLNKHSSLIFPVVASLYSGRGNDARREVDLLFKWRHCDPNHVIRSLNNDAVRHV